MKNKLHTALQNWVADRIFDDRWLWLEALIGIICDIEMYMFPIKHKQFKYDLDTCDVVKVDPNSPEYKSYAQEVIPADTLYCQGCPYYSYSKFARFIYGPQTDGYCYYLGKGDFSFIRPTQLLWDGCKECGINDDMAEFEYLSDEIDLGDNL